MGLFKRYKNTYIRNIKRTPLHFLAWFLGFYRGDEKSIVPEGFSYPLPKNNPKKKDRALFINHCTYLIYSNDCHFLTDPIWSERCSPVSFAGPKRKNNPLLSIREIDNLDYILISHNHYDHLDVFSIKEIIKCFPKVIFIVPMGLKKWFRKKKIYNVRELNWWESTSFQNKNGTHIEIVAVPAQHHSGRGLFDANKSLWAGFVVKTASNDRVKTFYFSGDTGYNSMDFKKIGENFTDIDLSICPIGTYLPSKFMDTVHIGPKGAVAIHLDIKPKLSIGMHWGTFCLSEEAMDAPPYDLYLELKKRGISHQEFLPLPPGDFVNW